MNMLEINGIDLHYGAAQALRGISLKAEAGKVTCVLGRNGVGKTSLLRAIVGQHPVSKGSILLGGADITRLSTVSRARSGVAFVPQGGRSSRCLRLRRILKPASPRCRATNEVYPMMYFRYSRC